MKTSHTITVQRGKNIGHAIQASLPQYSIAHVSSIDSITRNPKLATITVIFTVITQLIVN